MVWFEIKKNFDKLLAKFLAAFINSGSKMTLSSLKRTNENPKYSLIKNELSDFIT